MPYTSQESISIINKIAAVSTASHLPSNGIRAQKSYNAESIFLMLAEQQQLCDKARGRVLKLSATNANTLWMKLVIELTNGKAKTSGLTEPGVTVSLLQLDEHIFLELEQGLHLYADSRLLKWLYAVMLKQAWGVPENLIKKKWLRHFKDIPITSNLESLWKLIRKREFFATTGLQSDDVYSALNIIINEQAMKAKKEKLRSLAQHSLAEAMWLLSQYKIDGAQEYFTQAVALKHPLALLRHAADLFSGVNASLSAAHKALIDFCQHRSLRSPAPSNEQIREIFTAKSPQYPGPTIITYASSRFITGAPNKRAIVICEALKWPIHVPCGEDIMMTRI